MTAPQRRVFPFDGVVGQEDAKLALRLAAADPLIGGVLLRGQKGSAKTTLARGLAALLGDAPFIDLPLGATEDRLVGTLDARAALTGGEIRFEPGLLAAADGGVLYVDEINLLPDHLVDLLLDVAVSGENLVERDGISHRHPARFVLVGSMNPEEGELRPQLLDRMGLCVEVTAPTVLADRVESVRRRLTFDAGRQPATTDVLPSPVGVSTVAHLAGMERTRAAVPDEVMEAASELALAVGAEGLRADLTLCRASAALARIEGRHMATVEDLRRVAALVLAHRSRRGPFDPPTVPPEEIERALQDALDRHESDLGPTGDERDVDPQADAGDLGPPLERPLLIGAARRPPVSSATVVESRRGRAVHDHPAGPEDKVAVVASLRAAASRRRSDPSAALDEQDLRTAVRVVERSRTIVLCVDLSGSMGAPERASAASGTVLGLLADAYVRRHKVALVTFRGDAAATVLSPTSSIEVARNRLDGLATGGQTPLAAGLAEALRIAQRSTSEDSDALVVVLTDGRATGSGGLDRALQVAGEIRRAGVDALVLDCETGTSRLGLASMLADAMGARHLAVTDLEATALVDTIRAAEPR